jgi:hypothetical protein
METILLRFTFFFFLVVLEFELRVLGLALDRQVVYHLSLASSSFCSDYSGNKSLASCPGWPGLQSSYIKLPSVTGMAGVCHHIQFFSVVMVSCKLFYSG